MASITFYDPTEPPVSRAVLAGRVDSLKGKRVGLLWNNRPRGDMVLHALGEALTTQFGAREIVFTNKLRVGVGAPQAMIDDLARRTDAVVVGVGD
jgi:hypothetical protein